MPIKIPSGLPAEKTLEEENIFTINNIRADMQDIRPLRILLLNLMPTKIQTETQFARLLSNSAIQVELELLKMKNHVSKNTPESHLIAFYKTFDEVRENNYDGMVITGAPVEHMPFEEVEYWDELCEIMEWSKTHVTSTLHVCWAAQAGLYYHYGVQKKQLPEKLFGVFPHYVSRKGSMLFRGFDDEFLVPHSRHTTVDKRDILACPELKILAQSDMAGVYAVSTARGKQIFITGHSEYDAGTLRQEYLRDKGKGLPIKVPYNYFPNGDDTKEPLCTWRSSAHMLFSNWLNYFVYQSTPYDIGAIGK